jgi:hypothetical protein
MVTLASTVPVIGGVAVIVAVSVRVGEAVAVIVCVPVSVEVTLGVSDDSCASAAVSGLGALIVVAARMGTVIAEPTNSGNSKDFAIRTIVLIAASFMILACSFLLPWSALRS